MSEMKVVPRLEITPARLVYSNLPDADYPAWSAATSYAVAARVTHERINYECLVAGAGKTPAANPEAWLPLDWINRYRMFNKNIGNEWKIGTFSSNPDSIEFKIRPGRRINAIGLVGVLASTVHIVVTVPGQAEPVYEKTFVMSMKSSGNWYQYYFGPFTTKDNIAEFDLPPVSNPEIHVTISAPGSVAKLGTFVVGWAKSVGTAVYGTSLGRKKYTTINEKFDGSMSITRHGKRRLINFQVVLEGEQISTAQRVFDEVDDIPALYVGASELDYTVIVGIFDDFDTGLPTYNRGEYTLSVRSIT